MIDPTLIKQKAERLYPSFLKSIITGEKFFPIRFSVGSIPKDNFITLRDAVQLLIDNSRKKLGFGYTLELATIKLQKLSQQSIPIKISIDTEEDYLKLLKKEKIVSQFRLDVELIRAKVPELEEWLHNNQMKVIDCSDRWKDLLKVCQYFQSNPKPNLYIRELPIQVHTKFIEDNKSIISSLLEKILPLESIVLTEDSKCKFEQRFNLKYREHLVRMRLLDPTLKNTYGFPALDISIPVSEFEQLNLSGNRCFITENQMNFLTLPYLKRSFVIFGSGYGVLSLKETEWLLSCPIFYWGDLDLDGFKILSLLRTYFPQTTSVMMNQKTFERFQEFSVDIKNKSEILSNLTAEEESIYDYLVLHQKRLEQERITNTYACQVLKHLM